jgi:hypothetical protein
LASTIDEFGIEMDQTLLRSIKADNDNKLWKQYCKDKLRPLAYHEEDRWDRPLAKAPGRKSFESDVNTFLRLITRDLTIHITRHNMEAKVMEVGRQAGMLALTTEGKWVRQFIFNVGVSHPMDLLKESWQADGE